MTAAATYTSDFRHEFEAEHEQWLRERFLWYAAVAGGLKGVYVAVTIVVVMVLGLGDAFFSAARPTTGLAKNFSWSNTLLGALGFGLFAWAFVYVWRRSLSRRVMLRIVYWLIVVTGVLEMATMVIASQEASQSRSVAVASGGIWTLLVVHGLACIFLPWTPREAFRPLAPLLVINAVLTGIFLHRNPGVAIGIVCLSPFIAAPGLLICWYRNSRFRTRFAARMLRGRYAQLRQELFDAKRIHEAMFPPPLTSGPLRFVYQYEPMRQIGGDYIYARLSPPEGKLPPALNLLLIDVSGHGIAAALTVNRVYGELERIFAEDPFSRPGDVLKALNRYIHLTMARHSVYASALCLRIDPGTDTLEYASGGHPPAFICTIDGRIEQLTSTTFVLGACHGNDFEPRVETRPFMPGDTLIAYTDGALEARNGLGRHLGVTGLERILAGAVAGRISTPRHVAASEAARTDRGATNHGTHGHSAPPARDAQGASLLLTGGDGRFITQILNAVERHRLGPPMDDTLLVEISRAVVGSPVDTEKTWMKIPTPTR